MPDTVSTLTPAYTLDVLIARQRRPALPAFLARRLASTTWAPLDPPAVGGRRWLVETCRAELDWSKADWRRITGNLGISIDEYAKDPHPAEASRLPHEIAAARFLNVHLHVDVEEWRLRELRRTIRKQLGAAEDTTQSDVYRASWLEAARGTLVDFREHLARRRKAWGLLLAAAEEYRTLRAAIDAPTGAAMAMEAA